RAGGAFQDSGSDPPEIREPAVGSGAGQRENHGEAGEGGNPRASEPRPRRQRRRESPRKHAAPGDRAAQARQGPSRGAAPGGAARGAAAAPACAGEGSGAPRVAGATENRAGAGGPAGSEWTRSRRSLSRRDAPAG